jgi:S-methylmethionine-dependent homocysteine/selenocysteine methylase
MGQTTTTSEQQAQNMAPQSNVNDLWIFDGGTGREIERRGGPFRQPEWSALALYENPAIIRDIHISYIDAGATAITTNTYAVVPFHIGQDRYERDAKWLLELATDLAIQAKGDRSDVQVMGSIPPISGSYLPGKFDKAVAGPIIRDFLDAFHGKVDSIILETMGSAPEAKFALEELRDSGINVPVYLSFCIESVQGKPRLLTGDTLSDAIHYLQQSKLLSPGKVPLVMVNCCDIHLVGEALKELSSALTTSVFTETPFRIGAYPNAFSAPPEEEANVRTREVNPDISPTMLKSLADGWIRECGASAIGGCCGIGPDHIRAVAELKREEAATVLHSQQEQLSEISISKGCCGKSCGCSVSGGIGQRR